MITIKAPITQADCNNNYFGIQFKDGIATTKAIKPDIKAWFESKKFCIEETKEK